MVAQTSEASLIHTPHDRPPLDVDAVIKAITTIQSETDKQSIYQEKGEVKIKTRSPILLVSAGDLHIGNQATNHKKIFEIFKTVRDTPNTFLFLNGDLVDNLFVFRKGGAEEGMTAEMQGLLAMQFMSELDDMGKLVSVITGNHDCHDDKTELWTKESGWITHDKIQPFHTVATLNKQGEVEFHKPNKIIVDDYSGDMYKIERTSLNFCVTPNHRLLLNDYKTNINEYEYAEDFSKRVGITGKRFVVSGGKNEIKCKLTDDEIAIAGWILTDGYIRKNRYHSIGFTQRVQKSTLITDILDRLKINYSTNTRTRDIKEIMGKKLKSPSQPTVEIHVYAESNDYLLDIVSTKEQLPGWVWDLDDRQFDILLKSMVDGDGSRKDTKAMCLYKDNVKMLDQLQGLLAFHGYRSSRYWYDKEEHCRLNILKAKNIQFAKNPIKKVKYTGKIWCLNVENGNFLVRRKDCIHFSGNSFVDNFYRTFSRLKAPLMYNWGDTDISVEGLMYRLAQFHEFTMGNSTMSHTLRESKYIELRSPNADIVAGGHTHRMVISEVLVNGVARILMETGTMKINDMFQVGHGNARFGQFDYCGACVLLFPDQKKMIPFYHLEDGIEAVKGKLFIKQALFKGAGKILRTKDGRKNRGNK